MICKAGESVSRSREFLPCSPSDSCRIQPATGQRLNLAAIASLHHRHAVKVRVAGNDLPRRALAEPRVKLAKAGLPPDLRRCDPVNFDVVRIEVFSRVHQANLSSDFTSALKCHHANLADAAHSWIGRFYIDCDKPHCLAPYPSGQEAMIFQDLASNRSGLRPITGKIMQNEDAVARFLRITKTPMGDLDRAWSNAWGAALAHNPTYAKTASEQRKQQLRLAARTTIDGIVVRYRTSVQIRDHDESICDLSDLLSAEFALALRDGTFRIGTAQKLLNLYLKFLWCFGHISEPPDCPLDRVVQENARVSPLVNWTQIRTSGEYRQTMSRLREAVGQCGYVHLSLAQWELEHGWETHAA